MAAYWKQREHALGGGDHTRWTWEEWTTTKRKKWNLNQASTKRNWAWNWQHRYKPVSWARHIGWVSGPNNKIYEQQKKYIHEQQTNWRRRQRTAHEGERKQMIKKRQNRRQEKTKQDQYDTAAYVFTFVWIPSGTTFCSETPVLARIQRPERREITWTVHQRHL